MAKIKRVVFDAGPFIHLEEIKKFELVNLFSEISTTKEILEECKNIYKLIIKFSNIKKKELEAKNKDFAKYLIEEYNLDLGEATGISLCRQENIRLFFTDDLDAKDVANKLGFEAHGTIAIILRAFREDIINKKETKILVERVYKDSSLFFTKDLFDWTIREIDNYKK